MPRSGVCFAARFVWMKINKRFSPDAFQTLRFFCSGQSIKADYKLQITRLQQVCQDPRVDGHNFPFPWNHTLSLLDPYINYMLVYFYSLFALSPGVLNALWKDFTFAKYIFSILRSKHFQPADNIPNDLSRNLFLNNANLPLRYTVNFLTGPAQKISWKNVNTLIMAKLSTIKGWCAVRIAA